MATKPELRPARADSVIGITSLSDSFRMAHDLQAAIASFASGDGLHRLSMLTDKIPELEKDVEERDNRISQLAAQLATEQENHSTYNRKQLDTYNGQYDAWKVKEASLQGTTEKLQKELEARDKKISTLEMEREELKAKGREVAEKFRASSNNMKEKEQEIKRLKQLVTEAQGNVISYSKQLSDLQTRTTMLEKSSKAYKMENETNKAECNAYKDRLSQVLSFSVTLEELNLEDTANELSSLWDSALGLVGKFFGQDLPPDMLQDDWSHLRGSGIFKHQIPLPHSNSNVAKKMRVAVVLGILARLVDQYIFQPTYLLSDDSGFRELLRRQAIVHQKKEMFTRGIILSMFPEEHDSNGKNRFGCIVADLREDASVNAFLPHESIEPFEEELESFLVQAQDSWHSIQYGKQRLEPNFKYSHDVDCDWHELELSEVGGKDVQPGPPVAADGLEDELVIFPGIYLMESEPKPVIAGTVLRRAQFHAAAQEARRTTTGDLFSKPPSKSQRTRPRRSMTASGESTRDGPTKERKPVS